MRRRNEANRAEAIVRGVGSIVLLVLLLVLTLGMPRLLKGKTPAEMLNAMLEQVFVFALLAFGVVGIGLVVWLVVRNRK